MLGRGFGVLCSVLLCVANFPDFGACYWNTLGGSVPCKYSWCFLCDCVTKIILQGYHLSENSATISMLNLLLYLKCCPIPSICQFKMTGVIFRVGLVLFYFEPTSLLFVLIIVFFCICVLGSQ